MALNTIGGKHHVEVAALILISGTIVLIFFVILSGVRDVPPFNRTWFLQVDSSGITGSKRSLTQWTYFFICDAHNQNCGSPVPALPIGYGWQGGNQDVPSSLVGKYFYFLWRFGWVSYLMALFFVSLGWLVAIVSVWTRLGSVISGVLITFAFFWHSIAASLMTTAFVKARDSFLHVGIVAKVGPYAFGFTWGAWVALLLSMIMLYLGLINKTSDNYKKRRNQ
ncbi:Protein SUR7 [Erysiphe neolycopersici]|uniref:Protein SUR7 n=1 Tax=Erysiphe neolycopersici TaxID=212602 RepID=A0A420HIP3_9PEZI|nr:Protein SUR7 [Erysiphe neolycopersici]